mmetsp:Transcript_12303/g.45820  ORF Transcript_12303/g.45820 Transcript_12303/m.45820 type:complete len:384 (+) Transcript_12303:868-2019(+)
MAFASMRSKSTPGGVVPLVSSSLSVSLSSSRVSVRTAVGVSAFVFFGTGLAPRRFRRSGGDADTETGDSAAWPSRPCVFARANPGVASPSWSMEHDSLGGSASSMGKQSGEFAAAAKTGLDPGGEFCIPPDSPDNPPPFSASAMAAVIFFSKSSFSAGFEPGTTGNVVPLLATSSLVTTSARTFSFGAADGFDFFARGAFFFSPAASLPAFIVSSAPSLRDGPAAEGGGVSAKTSPSEFLPAGELRIPPDELPTGELRIPLDCLPTGELRMPPDSPDNPPPFSAAAIAACSFRSNESSREGWFSPGFASTAFCVGSGDEVLAEVFALGKQSGAFVSVGDASAASTAGGALFIFDPASGLPNTTTGDENGESTHASSTSIMETS